MRHDQREGSDRPDASKRRPDRMTTISQQTIAGRLIVAALAETDRADAAERLSDRLDYLAGLQERLAASLDETEMRTTLSGVCLPGADSWAIVDLVEADDHLLRLAIPRADPADQAIADELNGQWAPRDDDPFGYPAVKRAGETIALTEHVDDVLAAAAHRPENIAVLRALGFAACLVVPIRANGRITGAITFVARRARAAYTADEIEFAEQVAAACGRALDNVRQFAAMDRRRKVAEDSDRAKVDALGQVTHELRTPLSAIGGYAELMEMGVRGPITNDQRRDLERIRWNQQHLLSLISQILAYVRVETGRAEFTLADVDLGPAAVAAAEMVAPLIEAKGQVVTYEACEAGAAVALGDIDKIRQILINLITNAMKYSPDQARLVVRCGTSRTARFVEVCDEGEGIAADKLDSIFEPFVQLPGTAAKRGGGVGLGLAIARQLARGMHGELSVASELHVGSAFRLTLPSAEQARRATDS
ncbi:MAG TPA: HAMP domain-containing sensor histidine kinase [Gemmatimonadaceae bacterium]|nr:HAMP domain-containing sensor histidine kinase [Gemmatimonadaceae bacterium]